MSVLALPDRWRFDGVDLATLAVSVRQIDAAEDGPPLRGEDVLVPNLPGKAWAPKQPDARRLALACFVGGSNASGGLDPGLDELRQAQRNLDGLRELAQREGLRPLVHILPDGSERTAMAECVAFREATIMAARAAFAAVLDFNLPDPWFYGPPVVVSASLIGSPTDVALDHPGTATGHKVVLDLLGPVTNPRVTVLSTGVWVEALVTVGAGEHLVIDGAAFTAAVDATSAIGSIRHSGSALWLPIPPGAQTLRVTADAVGSGASIQVTFQPPYHA
jgi:hypothetical protein